jgi:Ca2+-binding RTX toxin-like protein
MSHTTKTLRAKLNLEGLEDRLNLSSYIYNGDLYIVGTNGADTVNVSYQGEYIKVVENGVTRWFYADNVWGGEIRFWGYAGNDFFNSDISDLNVIAYGMDGNDILFGDAGDDILVGGNGLDTLLGFSGDDDLYGGWGYDWLYGMNGNDLLHGGDDLSPDYMNGGAGYDYFQIDWFWTGWSWANRDRAADFNGWYDAFYNG